MRRPGLRSAFFPLLLLAAWLAPVVLGAGSLGPEDLAAMAEEYLGDGQNSDAEEAAVAALQKKKNMASAWLTLAKALAAQGKDEKALKAARRCLELSPEGKAAKEAEKLAKSLEKKPDKEVADEEKAKEETKEEAKEESKEETAVEEKPRPQKKEAAAKKKKTAPREEASDAGLVKTHGIVINYSPGGPYRPASLEGLSQSMAKVEFNGDETRILGVDLVWNGFFAGFQKIDALGKMGTSSVTVAGTTAVMDTRDSTVMYTAYNFCLGYSVTINRPKAGWLAFQPYLPLGLEVGTADARLNARDPSGADYNASYSSNAVGIQVLTGLGVRWYPCRFAALDIGFRYHWRTPLDPDIYLQGDHYYNNNGTSTYLRDNGPLKRTDGTPVQISTEGLEPRASLVFMFW